MEAKIFDVEHGFCAYIIADNWNVILIDCGHNSATGFRPSTYLRNTGCTGIQQLIISNYDEDHVSDFHNLAGSLPVQIFARNRSITREQLERLKLAGGPLGPGIQALLDIHESYNQEVTNPPDFAGIELNFFWNSYPIFTDTNNLSLVTFLDYRDLHIIFPGDLEVAGWKSLIQNVSFREHLSKVNVFVASHHGRESGYCEEVFNYCSPAIFVISDESKKYDTQEIDYSKHATGVQWHDGRTRYVLTTRKHGMITISQQPGGNAKIDAVR